MTAYNDFSWFSAAKLEQLALKEDPWNYFLETEVYLEAGNETGIVRPTDRIGLRLPPLGSLHVISAVQPWAEPDTKESAGRLRVLVDELQAAGIESVRAVGSSFSGDHKEESRAVFGLDDASARELGLRFGQVAVFSWNGPHWSLLACAGDREVHRSWEWTKQTSLV